MVPLVLRVLVRSVVRPILSLAHSLLPNAVFPRQDPSGRRRVSLGGPVDERPPRLKPDSDGARQATLISRARRVALLRVPSVLLEVSAAATVEPRRALGVVAATTEIVRGCCVALRLVGPAGRPGRHQRGMLALIPPPIAAALLTDGAPEGNVVPAIFGRRRVFLRPPSEPVPLSPPLRSEQ